LHPPTIAAAYGNSKKVIIWKKEDKEENISTEKGTALLKKGEMVK
jgi:hypothetical protein